MNFSQPLRVYCAQCKRPVLRCEWSFDPCARTYEVRVECHGDREICHFPRKVLFVHGEIVEAVAFRTKLTDGSLIHP